MDAIIEGIKYVRDNITSLGFTTIFVSLGGLFLKIITAWIQKKILEKRRSIEDFRDEVETIKIRQEGQESFVKTLQDHEVRIQIVERLVDNKLDEFIEDQHSEERRKEDIPVKHERRKKTELDLK